MPSAAEVAQAHYVAQQRLVLDTAKAAAQMWQQVQPADLLGSWMAMLGRLLGALTASQYTAASRANQYVSAALAAQGAASTAAGRVVPSMFAGVASDGRPLETLLLSPVFAAKAAIGSGATLPQALATGSTTLDMIVRTQVADAGRVADGVALAMRPRTGYVRLLQGVKSCSRCIVLAGRWYRYSAGFERHPNCDCIHVPAQGEGAAVSEGLLNDPKSVFDSMTAEQQDRAFGKAGAQAIRDGADMNQVVNARRGMSVAGTTLEGTTRRGIAGQRLRGAHRLMPEAIYKQANSREDAIQLLRAHGYII